jgi:hypothetical protein
MPKAFTYKTGILLATAVGLLAASCTDNGEKHRSPGRIYAPDMTYSRAYDYYNSNPNFADGHTARKPVEGTVSRNNELPDHMPLNDTNAYKTFTTSLRFTETEMVEAGRIYNIHCGVCHGTALDGNGPLYNGGNGKFAAAPANFKLEKYLNMPVGQMYHAVKYGINAMGSYASQLDIKERWMVIAYIKKVQSENGGQPFAFGTGTMKAGATTTKDTATDGKTDAAAASAAAPVAVK